MDLFNNNPLQNLLPYNGKVYHYGLVLNVNECNIYFNKFITSNFWKQDEFIMFGKQIVTARKVAWFGDLNYQYTYSNSVKNALQWTPELLYLKNLIESKTGEKFNSCLLNLYHNGNEGMGWHSDNEKELGKHPVIASLSFGASRKFSLKHNTTKQKIDLVLEPGSLLLMKGETQEKWWHSIPKSKKIVNPRINLTFRYIYT